MKTATLRDFEISGALEDLAADPVVRRYGAAQRIGRAARRLQQARVTADDGESTVLLPSTHNCSSGAGARTTPNHEPWAGPQAHMAGLHGGACGGRVRVGYDGHTYPDELGAGTEAAIDEAAADDMLHVLVAVREDADMTAYAQGGSPTGGAALHACTDVVRLARALWAVSRWDLPVAARCELARWQATYGWDAGWERYARAIGVAP